MKKLVLVRHSLSGVGLSLIITLASLQAFSQANTALSNLAHLQ
jgi:hypothetical protein